MEDTPVVDSPPLSLAKDKDYCFFVRHGQRADKSGDSFHGDLEITDFGKEQAEATGKVILQILETCPDAKVKIVTSPFLRCIMTANIIAKQIGTTEVNVEPLVMEGLWDKIFEEKPPIDSFLCRELSNQEFSDRFMDPSVTLNLPDSEEYEKLSERYPESLEQIYKRYHDYMRENNHINIKSEAPQVVIAVSHALSVDSVRDFGNGEKIIVDYCSVGCIEFDKENKENFSLALNGYQSHVKRAEKLNQIF
ncbi:unnamed protein product [Moneuplotes crassus]|uniref:Uncharacterized protein n=1 Tax=Euplotes crassus TaxID=5936 RepID=A0AAD1XQ32_EUPCR|nr:unnamed protein product [Moneuplotes crassus]